MRKLGIASIFIWIGFVAAISFMEAWLKFRAPGVTIPIGLGIGQLVFAALNKVEWVLSLLCALTLLPDKIIAQKIKYCLILPFGIVLIQTFWLLPVLDDRAVAIIEGQHVEQSNMHFYFVFVEILKLISLFLAGYNLLQKYMVNKIRLIHLN